MDLDLDLDSKFSKWILDYGSIFFHEFGFEIINGFGFGSISQWIWTWIWISILSWIGLDFGFHILLGFGFGLGFQFTNGFKSKSAQL